MKIGEAMAILEANGEVARKGWNGKGMFIRLQVPGSHSFMSESYIYLESGEDMRIPWTCSQADLLADDWEDVT